MGERQSGPERQRASTRLGPEELLLLGGELFLGQNPLLPELGQLLELLGGISGGDWGRRLFANLGRLLFPARAACRSVAAIARRRMILRALNMFAPSIRRG
jgi:hypothetical protein